MLELYKNIKKRREELGLSQEELANKMGYRSRSSINKIEMGLNDIPQAKIVAFAKALDTTPAALMGWDTSVQQTTPPAEAEGGVMVTDPEKLRVLDRYQNQPGMKMLFSLTENAQPEDIIKAAEIIQGLRKKRECEDQ